MTKEIFFSGKPIVSINDEKQIKKFVEEHIDSQFMSLFSRFLQERDIINPIKKIIQIFFDKNDDININTNDKIELFIKLSMIKIEEIAIKHVTNLSNEIELGTKQYRTLIQQFVYDVRWLFLNSAVEEIADEYDIIIQNSKKIARNEFEISDLIDERFQSKLDEIKIEKQQSMKSSDSRLTYI